MAQSKVVQFFRDKRNVTVHEEPVEPRVHIEQHMSESLPLHLSESLTVVMMDHTGQVLETRHAYSQPPEASSAPESTVTRRTIYRFDDWNGPEDALTLCRRYLEDLTEIVRDGQGKGLLTI